MNQTTFSFPYLFNRISKKTNLSSDNKSINECLSVLLRTRPGELLGNPNYGCNLLNNLFKYNGVLIDNIIKEDIVNAIHKYEPRIDITYNDIEIIQEDSKVFIFLTYLIKDTKEINEYNIQLTTSDNPYRN